jgi:hypothetical protein
LVKRPKNKVKSHFATQTIAIDRHLPDCPCKSMIGHFFYD